MQSSTILNPARPGDDFKVQQELAFYQWRIAVAIVERMREVGIVCELSIPKTPN